VTATGIAFTSNPNNFVLAGATASAAVGTIGQATITVAGATGVNKIYERSAKRQSRRLASRFRRNPAALSSGPRATATIDGYSVVPAGFEVFNFSGSVLGAPGESDYQISSAATGSGFIVERRSWWRPRRLSMRSAIRRDTQ